MNMPVVVKDGYGSGNKLKVNGNGEIRVAIEQRPVVQDVQESFPIFQYFTDNGLPTGSEDMRVDGSVTPQEFFVQANPDRDIFIKTIRVRISDTGAGLDEFGNLSELTNGVDWYFQNNALGRVDIATEIKTNIDWHEICLQSPVLGSGSTAFKADVPNAGGGDTYLPTIDLATTFGLNTGFHLRKSSKDKLAFVVNDDLSTGITIFRIRAYGVQI